jgi:hypothetical protein
LNRSANPGLLGSLAARFHDSNVQLWGFDGSASVPPYIVLLPDRWLLEPWRGSPAISPLVLTKDLVASVRPQRNVRWIFREIDKAVNGGGWYTVMEVNVHTGSRYATRFTWRLEVALNQLGAQKLTSILG